MKTCFIERFFDFLYLFALTKRVVAIGVTTCYKCKSNKLTAHTKGYQFGSLFDLVLAKENRCHQYDSDFLYSI